MVFMRLLLLSIISLVLLFSCSSKEETAKDTYSALPISNFDTTIRPQDDFYQYANGGWLAQTTVPPDQGSWGAFHELMERTQKTVLDVLQRAAADTDRYPEGTPQRKAADFFAIGMDSLLAEQQGIKPIQGYLDKINAIQTRAQLQDYLTEQLKLGGGAFFALSILTDLKDNNKMSAYLLADGLGLPDRDYYLKYDAKSRDTREAYERYLVRLFVLAGSNDRDAAQQAADVLQLETQLAKATFTKEQQRNPMLLYNPTSINQLETVAPVMDWEKYFRDLMIQEDSVIVTEVNFLRETNRIIATYSMEDIKTYLRAAWLRHVAPYLSYAFVKTSFEFNNNYLLGAKVMQPRWKRVLAVTDTYIGEAIGRLYVQEVFPPEAKATAYAMVENIKLAFAGRIKDLSWMSDSTKMKALEKLQTMAVKIGYPDEWKNYTGLAVERNPERTSYVQNVLTAMRYHFNEEINKLGKPVDRQAWAMTPQTINAYYNPLFNEIVFPAAILQPPFYDYRADAAVNYGGIGAVIGHEISHGFDDQGSQFDASGNLKNWWREDDLIKFKALGKKLVAQYNAYEPLPDVFVQGEFTLGENIGDLGGMAAAYDGLLRHFREQTQPPPHAIDGFTPNQRFFLSWATIWRTQYTDAYLRTQVLTDPHAPGMYRANGPLSNFDPFYEAFGVKEGDKMYRPSEERVKIW